MQLDIRWNNDGLAPCIVQDNATKEVLMLAYMNKESLELSIRTKIAHYFSRSKQRVWMKGESSGNTQKICSLHIDCDSDSILINVEQNGVACHTGNKSCFFMSMLEDHLETTKPNSKEPLKYSIATYGVLDTLYHTLLERKNESVKSSYTSLLYTKGDNAIAKKVIEEAGEFCFAFKDKEIKEIVYECADLFYHIFVALASLNIHPDIIYQELLRRMGTSGIEEKQSRSQSNLNK